MPVDMNEWTGSLALTEVEEQPAKPLTVKYGSLEIRSGESCFTFILQVQDRPTSIEWESCDPSKLYTLAMTDPDAPSRKDPKFRSQAASAAPKQSSPIALETTVENSRSSVSARNTASVLQSQGLASRQSGTTTCPNFTNSLLANNVEFLSFSAHFH
uniref:Uncharacterized protein n=1 Tax=Sinocyclocheilus anshuiensis TaxID=1608454 RepID=A0A671NM89_9TELE